MTPISRVKPQSGWDTSFAVCLPEKRKMASKLLQKFREANLFAQMDVLGKLNEPLEPLLHLVNSTKRESL